MKFKLVKNLTIFPTIEEIFNNDKLVFNIEKETMFNVDEVNKRFVLEVYADYRDEFPISDLDDILNTNNNDYMLSFECQVDSYYEFHIMDSIFELENKIQNFYPFADYDYIHELILDNIDINLPYDHYLKQEIRVVIQINPKSNSYYNDSNESNISLKWLLKSQGYGNWKNINKSSSKFSKDIIDERDSLYYPYGLPTFLVTMTIGQLLDYYENKDNMQLKIKAKDIELCGIADITYNGSGGMVIENLEKDLILNSDDIYLLKPDEILSMSIDGIFGLTSLCWNTPVELIKVGVKNEK